MFLFDILAYVLFAIIMSNLARKSECITIDSDKWDRYLKWYVMFFTFVAAIRWNVGSDSISYAIGFAKGLSSDARPEFLWQWLVDTIHNLDIHWTIGMGFVAFLQIFFIVKSVKRYRFILIMLPFVLFGGRYWLDMMGGMRQMIVACGFLWASKFIYEKKLWKYLLFVFIAAQIHRSAFILIPFYFIPNSFQIENKRILLIIILILCCLIGQTPAYQGMIGYIEAISNLIGYEDYTARVGDMLMKERTSEALAFGPMMLTYLLIPIFLLWFGPRLKQVYGEVIPYFNLWYNLAYFYACIYFLVCNISHIFIRPVMYFSLFQMIMAALLLYELLKSARRNSNMQWTFIIFAFIIFTNSAWDIYKASGRKWESTTYKVFFMHWDQISLFKM